MPHSEPKKLSKAKKLFKEGKIKNALQLVTDLEKEGELSINDQLSSQLFKGSLLIATGLYNDALTLAKQVLKESQKLGKNLQLIDACILEARILSLLGRLDNAFDVIIECEALLKTFNQESSLEIAEREAWVAFVKGVIYGAKGEKDQELKYLKRSLILREELGDKQGIFTSLTLIAKNLWSLEGDLDLALNYTKRCQKICWLWRTLSPGHSFYKF